ncbi:type II secretion system protein GspM [Phytopseudomonas daroniae]|uniref:type II secretion system protein GspM n=1 Tax=Phytopseudomonas daroniae TaxID=2487519 RepID=UPI0010384B59|nr:type II secretion system protein GspM [Pseudomonas daroniae]TBU74082.1 hypothetical protein DNK10_15685 [Pseudomonas daroniae]
MRFRYLLNNRRTWAVLLLGTCFVFIYILTVHWWFTSTLLDIADEMQELRGLQQRYSKLDLQKQFLAEKYLDVQRQGASEGLLGGVDAGAATAQMMELIAQAIYRASEIHPACKVLSQAPMPPAEIDGLVGIRINLELECGTEVLVRSLYHFEDASPFLFIQSLRIRRGGQSEKDLLIVQISLIGYAMFSDDGERCDGC